MIRGYDKSWRDHLKLAWSQAAYRRQRLAVLAQDDISQIIVSSICHKAAQVHGFAFADFDFEGYDLQADAWGDGPYENASRIADRISFGVTALSGHVDHRIVAFRINCRDPDGAVW